MMSSAIDSFLAIHLSQCIDITKHNQCQRRVVYWVDSRFLKIIKAGNLLKN